MAWLGQNRPERPIVVTIIYLSPDSYVGDTLVQHVPGQAGWSVTFSCVKLWELDAAAALTSGLPAVVTLAPLMRGATEATVEEAAQRLLTDIVQPTQAELLTALGVFAEPIFDNERFVRLVTKERLMSSSLISYLFKEEMNEMAKQKAELVQEKAELQEQLKAQRQLMLSTLQETLEDAITARFPDAPMSLKKRIRTINDAITLQQLVSNVFSAPDLATVEQALAAAQPA